MLLSLAVRAAGGLAQSRQPVEIDAARHLRTSTVPGKPWLLTATT